MGVSRTAGVVLLAAVLAAGDPASAPAQTGDTVRVSLADAERLALQNNPLLDRAAADVKLSRARKTRAAHARYLPTFNLRNVWGPIPRQRGEFTDTGVLVSPDSSKGLGDLRWFTQVDLQLLQPIYTFGKAGAVIDAAEARVDVSEAGLETVRDEVRLQVRKLYWGLVLGNELLRVVQDVLDQVEEADARLQERYEEGEATQNDRFKFRIFEYEIHKRHRMLLDRVATGREGLRAAMGLEEGTPVRVERTVLEPVEVTLEAPSHYMTMARRHRPELQQLRAGIAARNSLVQAENSDALPRLFVGGQLTLNQAPSRFDPANPFWDDQTNFFRPGLVVGLDWNLNLVHHRDEARVSRYEAAKLRAQMAPLVEKIRREVREAHLQVQRARADVEEGRGALKAADNWLRAEFQTYDIGIGEIKDLIDAFRANVEMQTDQLRNIFELRTAVAELSRAVGRDLAVTAGTTAASVR